MTKYTVDPDGTQEWYLNGQLHRTDGPALIYPDGEQRWYINGKLHREDGPAMIVYDGTQYWYLNGKRHREDGPAVIGLHGKEWWLDGVRQKPYDDIKVKKITINELQLNIKDGF